MAFKNDFYAGSLFLTPLSERVGIPIDQVNFLVCQLVALGFAFPFRKYLSVEAVGVKARHLIEAVVGVLLAVFCFGYQVWHLLAQSLVSYIFMSYGGSRFSHSVVFVFTMLYLAVCHIYRQVYDYGGYTLDITGPLMIQTQKLTSLAFALHDGRFKNQASLSPDQKEQAVRKLPTILEYLSYTFCFHGIMVGPLTFYNDYIAFIDGSSISKYITSGNTSKRQSPLESLNKLVLKKSVIAAACCIGMLILPGMFFPPEKLNSPEFYTMNFVEKVIFILGALTLSRFKYYFAWILADALNNAAGFGFSGYDSEGVAKWDLTDNVSILGVELSTSLKVNIDSWNKKTIIWLRRVVYDRAPFYNTLAVFATSAFWHGFYPGYYIMFGSGALMTIVGRQVRRNVRPYFQTSQSLIYIYEVITFIATRLTNSYLTFPFLILEFNACLQIYMSLYFYLHVLTMGGFVYFTFIQKPEKRAGSTTQSTTNGQSLDIHTTVSRTHLNQMTDEGLKMEDADQNTQPGNGRETLPAPLDLQRSKSD